jgi:protein phosphatase
MAHAKMGDMFAVLLLGVPALTFAVATALLVRELRLRARKQKVERVRRRPLSSLAPPPELDRDHASTGHILFEIGTAEDDPTSSRRLLVICASGRTDTGQRRARNEDAVLLLPDHGIFAVADGMGGHACGDLASQLAVSAIEDFYRSRKEVPPPAEGRAERPKRASELVSAIESANVAIREHALQRPDSEGMGSTIVAARFSERKRRAFIGHVGDSRCYRFRDGQLRLMTTDHTLAMQGVRGPLATRVCRALGTDDRVPVDILVDKPEPGDVYMLCSDGLSKMVDDTTVQGILASKGVGGIGDAVQTLVDEANRSGGADNVSVILIAVSAAAA